MGVATRKWGPVAWCVLEGLANAYDENYRKNPRLRFLFSTILYLFGFVLPCVYCRLSFREFTNGENPQTDIWHMLQKGKATLLIYNVHECVNEKLFQQKCGQQAKRARIPFSEIAPVHISSFKFWESLMVLLGYVMCDYRECAHAQIVEFLEALREFLFLVSQTSLGEWDARECTKLACRITSVWEMFVPIMKANKWKLHFSKSQFQDLCRAGIVLKCIKNV